MHAYTYIWKRTDATFELKFNVANRRMQDIAIVCNSADAIGHIDHTMRLFKKVLEDKPIEMFAESCHEQAHYDRVFVLKFAIANQYKHLDTLIASIRPNVDIRKEVLATHECSSLEVLPPLTGVYELYGCKLTWTICDGDVPTCDTAMIGKDPRGLTACMRIAHAIHAYMSNGAWCINVGTEIRDSIAQYIADGKSLRGVRKRTFYIDGCAITVSCKHDKYTVDTLSTALVDIFAKILRGEEIVPIVKSDLREWYNIAVFIGASDTYKHNIRMKKFVIRDVVITIDRETLESDSCQHIISCKPHDKKEASMYVWYHMPVSNTTGWFTNAEFDELIRDRKKW